MSDSGNALKLDWKNGHALVFEFPTGDSRLRFEFRDAEGERVQISLMSLNLEQIKDLSKFLQNYLGKVDDRKPTT